MKQLLFSLTLLIAFQSISAQTNQDVSFYIGASVGTAFTLGDFKDTDISNLDAGFAKNGTKLDLFGGYFLNDKVTLTGIFRYQIFDTQIEDLVNEFNTETPNANFSANTESWQVYSLLVGAAYKINVYKKFAIFPRIGIGPMLVNNPSINVSSPDSDITQNFIRSTESGFGLGYEFGIGFTSNLGKRLALMPTFTFSGGIATISDVTTVTDNIVVNGNYNIVVQSFNLGISLAYKFY